MQQIIFQGIVEIATKYITDSIRSAPKAPVSVYPPLPSHQPDGCPACQLHEKLSNAYGLLDDTANAIEQTGEIPKGAGGTLTLASQSIEQAIILIRPIKNAAPELKEKCESLEQELTRLKEQLGTDITPSQVRALSNHTLVCRQMAFDIAVSYFSREPKPDPIIAWINRVKSEQPDTDTAIKQLKEILNA